MFKIMFCTCSHPWQDGKYGPQKRVHNPTKKGHPVGGVFRCTVCGKENTK